MSQDEKIISWPGWEVVRLIGRGSFGAVYEIQRDVLGSIEKAALKVISIPQNASDIDEMYSNGYDEESITNTFKFHLKGIVEEYSMMRKLSDCPNIVTCDDVRYIQHDDQIGWDIFIKMELLIPLLKSIQTQVSEETVINLAKDICSALVSCKQYNIVHRDIKPQNIFLSSSGIYKLGDFGIAKTVEKTMGGTKVGTYNYMAPEVYNNKPYGSAADIYSLGLVLYWLLNERRMPFLPLPPAKLSVGMDEAARYRRLSGECFAEPKNGSKRLKEIVMKACAYNIEDRYSSASDMLMDLKQLEQMPHEQPIHKNADVVAHDDETVNTFGVFMKRPLDGLVIPDTEQEEKTVALFPGAASHVFTEGTRASKASGISGFRTPQSSHEYDPDQTAVPYSNVAPPSSRPKYVFFFGVISAVLMVAALVFALWPWHTHVWEAASCEQPKTCSECGTTQGDALGHQIVSASCESPEHCTRCNIEFGKALNHTWQKATLSMPETCSVCSSSRGVSLGDQILLDAQKDAEAGRYRQAIHSLDNAWKYYGEQTFFDQAATYRAEFGMYANRVLAAGKFNSILLDFDGSPWIVGDNSKNELQANSWSNIVAVSLGDRHVLGLSSNGTVWAGGDNDVKQGNVNGWQNVIAISAGDTHSVALLENGRVIATGYQHPDKCDTQELMEAAGSNRIVAISAGYNHTLALLDNGRVVGTGNANNRSSYKVSDWTNIAAIATGTNFSAGLKTDGTVEITGASWNVSGWNDIIALAAGDYYLLGLCSDGTVVSVGGVGKPDVSGWRNIVCIAAGHDHAVAIDSKGDVHNAGSNAYGQHFASGTNILD